jgi:hypothetical protein
MRRPLPRIRQARVAQSISSHGRNLNSNCVSQWIGFVDDVKGWIEATDLSFEVSLEGCLDEEVLVGNESSLVGRLLQNVGVPVGRVLQNIEGAARLRFGDSYCGNLDTPRYIPDLVLLHDSNYRIRLVGEVKPFWLLEMPDENPGEVARMQQPLGNVPKFF